MIRSYRFNVDQHTKRLSIDETAEYTVNLSEELFNQVQHERDAASKKNLLELLSKFRLFNLTKLIKTAGSKGHISRLIKEELGTQVFTFKHYSLDKNQAEITEDYCFHLSNYEAVKNRFSSDELRKVMSLHMEPIMRRMKKFGIYSLDFSDYRDTKLDYLMSVMLEELSNSFDKRDLVDVKNFASLRTCLLKVNRVIDPLLTCGDDMISYVRESGLCRDTDLKAVFTNISGELMNRWLESDLDKKRILVNENPDGSVHLIDGTTLATRLAGLHKTIIGQPEQFNAMSQIKRNEYLSLMDLLCEAGDKLLSDKARSGLILGGEQEVARIRQIISDYDSYKSSELEAQIPEREEDGENISFMKKLGVFIVSLFRSKEDSIEGTKGAPRAGAAKRNRRPISRQTRDIFSQIKTRNSPLIALSDYLELSPENESRVDTIINEIRQNNLKIVIPVYNARSTLYPVRSQRNLMADIEYLFVDSDIIRSPEEIRAFTDSLAGYKLKDEIIPGRGIMTIENYLLTIYRQNKAKKLRKKG